MTYRTGKLFLIATLFIALSMGALDGLYAQGEKSAPGGQPPSVEQATQKPTMVLAVTCEKVENLNPVRQSIVFSVSGGQVCCFTSFDPVHNASVIYHRWFHRDEMSTQIRLKLYSPRWATYSVIQLRETDKGPWRVEITDQSGIVLDVLRFSITD